MDEKTKIKVKISYPYDKTDFLTKMLPCQDNSDIEFVVNPEEKDEVFDYWIIFNYLRNWVPQTTICPKQNTIFIAVEPYDVACYVSGFLRQFGVVIAFQDYIIKKIPQARLYPPLSEWFVEQNFDYLNQTNEIKKTKLISIISSNKKQLKGHRDRLAFCEAVKARFGNQVDFFGRGIASFDDKWDVVAPYKYSIAIENSQSDNYFTEKINDCFLSHTFPIYYGCPNIKDYFNPESFATIDIKNIEKSIQTIESILNDYHHYETHLSAVIESKKRVLDHYNLFAFCKKIIMELEQKNIDKKYEPTTIKQRVAYTPEMLYERTKHRIHKKYKEFF